MNRHETWLTAFGRLLICAIFLWDVTELLGSPADAIAFISASALPFPKLAYLGAVAVELVGGIALLVGWRARWAAAALALFCFATAAFFHAEFANPDMKIHFLKNLAMAGGLLQIVARGAGGWSLDARAGRP